MKDEEVMVAIVLVLAQHHCRGVEGQAEQAPRRGLLSLLMIF
jgi:hypothetical protein